MNKMKRQSKRIISILLIIVMLISTLPNFGLLKVSNAADFQSGVILRLDTEKGIWTDDYGDYWAVSLDILVKDANVTSFVLPIQFDTTKLTPAYYYVGRRDEYIDYAGDAEEFTSNMNSDLASTFNANDKSSDTDWSKVKDGKIVLEFLDSKGETYNFEGETLICTINFIVSNEITDISQIDTTIINIDESEKLFQIFDFENNKYYEDVNTYFSIQGMDVLPTMTSLTITTNPTAEEVYEHGNAIYLLGGKLTATFSDGTTKEISMLDESVKVKTGEKEGAYADINNPKLTFTYEGQTVDLDVNVIDPIDNIKFYDKNNILVDYEFLDGNQIPLNLLYLQTTTKSGVVEEISLADEKVTLDSEIADATKIKNPYYDEGLDCYVGIQEVQITYTKENETKTTSFNILVNDMVGEIKISDENKPEETLIINDKFEKTGAIEIIGKYSGISFGEIEMSSNDVKVTEKDGSKVTLDKVESKELLVSFTGVTTTYTVNVINTVTAIEVNMPKDYVEVKYGEELTQEAFAGITITEKYADGTEGEEKALDLDWIDASNFNKESLSKQELEINYPCGEKTIKGTIVVKAKNELKSITINNLQTEYIYKDKLNYEGAELFVAYISGETGPYEIDETTLSNDFDSTKIGEQDVTFTYSDGVDEISTIVTVNVKRATLDVPECSKLTIYEDTPLSTLQDQLPTTEYGSVVWENPAQTLKMGTYQINAVYKMSDTYKEFYYDVALTVEVEVISEEIEELSLKTAPDLEYYEGQTFDASALELSAKYTDGTTGIITGGYTIEGIELDKALTLEDNGKIITVKYKSFDPIELTLVVVPDEVTGIELNTENAKTTYKYNEELDLSNITVKKVMASGIEQSPVAVADNEEVTISDNYDKTNITDVQTITVAYAGFTETYTVKVEDYVNKIELPEETKTALEKEYLYGDTLQVVDGEGNPLYINVYMASDIENPKLEVLTLDMINVDTTKLGEQVVTVEYREGTTIFNITVADYVAGIEIVSQPTKRIYKLEEELDLTGLIVRDVMASEATVEAGNTTLTEEQYEVSVLDSTVAGTKTITITRKDISVEPVTFKVVVVENDENLEIQINELPTATTYYGKEVDLTGGSVIVKPEGATEGTIIQMTDEAITVEGYDPYLKGEQTITLVYTYQEAVEEGAEPKTLEIKLPIVVVDYKISDIKLITAPTQLTYKYGEALNLTGGEVARLMASGIEFAKKPLETSMISGYDPNKLGTQTITVTYYDGTITFDVNVVDNIYGIVMNSKPDKTSYKYDEEIDLTGATIKVTKDSGDKIISLTPDMISGYDKTKPGEQLITVSYEGFTTQFTVTVEKKAVIAEDNVVNKVEYIVVFKDFDGTILKRDIVTKGESAIPPEAPERNGYKFIGWDKDYSNIQEDTIIYAQYEKIGNETEKPTQTLGEKDKTSDASGVKETLVPAIIGLAITGTLLLLVTVITKKNVEIYAITDERKLVGKQRISKKEKTIYLDEYKEDASVSEIELVIDAKTAEKLDGEDIKVVLNRKETSYTVNAKGEENVSIKVIK